MLGHGPAAAVALLPAWPLFIAAASCIVAIAAQKEQKRQPGLVSVLPRSLRYMDRDRFLFPYPAVVRYHSLVIVGRQCSRCCPPRLWLHCGTAAALAHPLLTILPAVCAVSRRARYESVPLRRLEKSVLVVCGICHDRLKPADRVWTDLAAPRVRATRFTGLASRTVVPGLQFARHGRRTILPPIRICRRADSAWTRSDLRFIAGERLPPSCPSSQPVCTPAQRGSSSDAIPEIYRLSTLSHLRLDDLERRVARQMPHDWRKGPPWRNAIL